MTKRVPLIDRLGNENREIGYIEVNEETGEVGDMVITDADAKLKFSETKSFSIAESE